MNEKQPTPPTVEYRCPGERQPISRAVHLGRLAAFYPACRQCPHREDTGSLSPRQVEQLAETAEQRRPRPLFHDEGAGGVFLDDLAPADARLIAAAFCAALNSLAAAGTAACGGSGADVPSAAKRQQSSREIILAGDGRPIAAELVASVAEGLRWSGRDVVDIGPATAACMAFAVHHLRAAGGVLVGNPGVAPQEVGLQFWMAGPHPLSAGGGLESVAQLAETDLSRPTRRGGQMSRFQADEPYLAALSDHYHALRPLRVVVDSASKPLLHYLQRLCTAVACEIIPLRAARRDLSDQIRAEAAHFAVQIDGDGETCRVFDEQGREAPPERVLLLLAAEECPPVQVVTGPRRADVSRIMRENGAMLGFGPGVRYWHSMAGVPLPDALMTVTWLLKILSRGDEPLSGVLDRDSPEM